MPRVPPAILERAALALLLAALVSALASAVPEPVLAQTPGRVAVLRVRGPRGGRARTLLVSSLEEAGYEVVSDRDVDAARRLDGTFNRWFLDPLFRGRYPEDAIADRVRRGHLVSADLPFVHAGDLAAIAVPTDFVGINYYSRAVVKAGPDGEPVGVPQAPPEQLTEMGWEVRPQAFYDVLVRITRDYSPRAIHVTENGAAFADPPPVNGRVSDPRRVDFLRTHLAAALRAIEAGVPLAGYFAWSLLDNWEWAEGYTRRFGLYRVDFETQQRTIKDSALFYRDVVAARAVPGAAQQSS